MGVRAFGTRLPPILWKVFLTDAKFQICRLYGLNKWLFSVPHYIEQTVFDVSNWKLPLRVRFPHVPIFNCRRRTNCEKFGANFLYNFRGWKCSISGKTFLRTTLELKTASNRVFGLQNAPFWNNWGVWAKIFYWDQIEHIWDSLWYFFLGFIELTVADIIAPRPKSKSPKIWFLIFLNFIWSKFGFCESFIFMCFFEATFGLLYMSREYVWMCIWKGIP